MTVPDLSPVLRQIDQDFDASVARLQALLRFPSVGVDPEHEPVTNRLVRSVPEGRYLVAGEPGGIVLGHAIARRLSAGLDDDILASVVGIDGSIESTMFRPSSATSARSVAIASIAPRL